MALDLPLPRQVLTHAHWTLGREKMSKSTGNVVNPFFALDRFGVDTMRYYLAHDGGIRDDADYENSYIIKEYKKGLQGGLGNLVSRVMRGKGWDVRKAVELGTSGDPPAEEYPARAHGKLLMELPRVVSARMEELDSGAALKAIMDAVYKVRPREFFILRIPADHLPPDECIHAKELTMVAGRDGRTENGTPQQCHLPMRGVASHLRHSPAALHAGENEAIA